jgi:hypothetical protein
MCESAPNFDSRGYGPKYLGDRVFKEKEAVTIRMQCSHLDTAQWMCRGDATFEPGDVEQPVLEVDWRPLEVAQLLDAQSTPPGDEDHGRIAVAVATPLAHRVHKQLDLVRRQVLTRPAIDIALPAWGSPTIRNRTVPFTRIGASYARTRGARISAARIGSTVPLLRQKWNSFEGIEHIIEKVTLEDC